MNVHPYHINIYILEYFQIFKSNCIQFHTSHLSMREPHCTYKTIGIYSLKSRIPGNTIDFPYARQSVVRSSKLGGSSMKK